MRFYKTKSYSNTIEEIEVERHTDKTIWYYREWNGKKKLDQARKESSYENYFETHQQAKQFLLDKVLSAIERAEIKLSELNNEYEEIKSL